MSAAKRGFRALRCLHSFQSARFLFRKWRLQRNRIGQRHAVEHRGHFVAQQQHQAALNELIRRYPGTRYAADARLKLDLVNDHLAGKEMTIGRSYQRSGKWLAASLRFRNVIDTYQTTSHTPEALYRLVESYLAMGIPAEAQKAAAVLGANYPGNEWYGRAYALMQRHAPGTSAS